MSNEEIHVIQAADYDETERALAEDPIIVAMAAELVGVRQLDRENPVEGEGVDFESWSFMHGALDEYRKRGGTIASHIGGPAAAIRDLLDRGELADWLQNARCEAEFVTKGPDPYATDCKLKDGHDGPHRGPDPFGAYIDVEWEGGGTCAGDPLPYRNVRFIDVEK